MSATKPPVPSVLPAHPAPSSEPLPPAAPASPRQAESSSPPMQAASSAPPLQAKPPAPQAHAAAAAPPAPTAPPGGIEALANNLSAMADALHERIMRAVRQHGHGKIPPGDDLEHGITQKAAQELFEQEVLLRQCANRLYVQSAILAAANVDTVRHDLLVVTAVAQEQLRHVAKVQALVALTADLVTLAGTLAAGKPDQWPGAVREVRARLNALHDANNP